MASLIQVLFSGGYKVFISIGVFLWAEEAYSYHWLCAKAAQHLSRLAHPLSRPIRETPRSSIRKVTDLEAIKQAIPDVLLVKRVDPYNLNSKLVEDLRFFLLDSAGISQEDADELYESHSRFRLGKKTLYALTDLAALRRKGLSVLLAYDKTQKFPSHTAFDTLTALLTELPWHVGETDALEEFAESYISELAYKKGSEIWLKERMQDFSKFSLNWYRIAHHDEYVERFLRYVRMNQHLSLEAQISKKMLLKVANLFLLQEDPYHFTPENYRSREELERSKERAQQMSADFYLDDQQELGSFLFSQSLRIDELLREDERERRILPDSRRISKRPSNSRAVNAGQIENRLLPSILGFLEITQASNAQVAKLTRWISHRSPQTDEEMQKSFGLNDEDLQSLNEQLARLSRSSR